VSADLSAATISAGVTVGVLEELPPQPTRVPIINKEITKQNDSRFIDEFSSKND
jgi:hypothetical protein